MMAVGPQLQCSEDLGDLSVHLNETVHSQLSFEQHTEYQSQFGCHRQNPHCKLLGGYKSRQLTDDVLCRPSLQKISIFYCVKETIAQECVGGDFWMHHNRSAFAGIQHEPQFPAIQTYSMTYSMQIHRPNSGYWSCCHFKFRVLEIWSCTEFLGKRTVLVKFHH